MATPELRPLGNALGTEALGVDLSKLDDPTFDWIQKASAEHPVLVFRNQHLGAGDIAAFGRRFGTPRIHSLVGYRHEEHPEVSWLRNVDAEGNIDWYGVKRATDWHTDSTYEEVPPLLAMLHALEVPSTKGGTMFADMCAAYDALPQAMKDRLAGLVGLHGRTDGPAGARLYDPEDTQFQGIAEPGCLLVAATAGEPEVARAEAAVVARAAAAARDLGPEPWERWRRHRYDLSAERMLDMLEPPGAYLDTIEIAAGWRILPAVYREVKSALTAGSSLALCHFSHAYPQGCCAYFTFAGSSTDEEQALAAYGRCWAETMRICLARGATISHHHGVGQARAAWARQELDGWWPVWEKVRAALDPGGVMNPKAVGGR